MNIKKSHYLGFTLIEVLIVIAIGIVIFSVIFKTFSVFNERQELYREVEKIGTILKEAHSKTLFSKYDTSYGVHLESTRVVLFRGNSFVESDIYNTEYILSSALQITSINLNGNGNDILFAELSGETSQYGTTTISSLTTGETKDIVIRATGIIEF